MEHKLPPHFEKHWAFRHPLEGGGQATAWVVAHKESGAEGVLKLPKGLEKDRVAAERFQREIEVLRRIDHPAIVKLLDYSLDPAELGYVSPRGKVLTKFWPARTEKLSPLERYDLAYQFMRAIGEGLALVHENDIVHRDLKPSNVIVLDPWTSPRPVVIDFGLAFRQGDERVSVLNGRPVANVVAAPAEAYYGHITPTPAWDCIGLGWLYGYLVGAGIQPLNNRFHWKFHPLIEEERTARLKALLAQCSDVDVAPQNARGFVSLMENLGLGAKSPKPSSSKADFSAAQVARLNAVAAENQRRVEMADRVKISVASLTPILAAIRDGLNGSLAEHGEMPITLNGYNTNPTLAARPIEDHLMAAYADEAGNPAVLFTATCGTYPRRRFNVAVYVHHQRDAKAGQQPFCLRIWCADEGGKFNHQPYFFFENDGSIVDSQEGQKRAVTSDELVRRVVEMVTDPANWKFTS